MDIEHTSSSHCPSRRSALKTGLAAAGAALIPQAAAGRAPADGDDTKNMHLSLAAYSMREALTDGQMDLFDFIDWCAELGLAGTELTSYYFEEGFDEAYLKRLQNRAFRNGLTVSGTAIRNNFCLPPGPKRQKQIEHVEAWIDHAAAFFAPHVRIFAGDTPDGVDRETGIQWVADSISAVLDRAAERGVVVGLENHHGITARARDHVAICEAVGEHPWFGINLDTGNYHTDVYQDLAMAAPRAVNVQVKTHVTRGGEEVPTDFERIKQILVDADYRGWVVLEYEADEDPRTAIPRYVDTLQDLF